MAESVATWNEDVLGVPAINGFMIRFLSTQVRKQPLSGAGRFYQRQAEIMLEVEMSVPMNALQFANFVAFWEITLARGRNAFTISIYVGPQKEEIIATIVDGYNFNILGRKDSHAIVRMRLEGYRVSSNPFTGPTVVYVSSGTPAAPSSDEEQIRGGFPYDPSVADFLVYGGEYIGRPYAGA